MSGNDAASEVRELLLNRVQILFHATSGYSDGKSSLDARRLDEINEQLAGFGITDEGMTAEQFDDDLDRGLITLPSQKSKAGTAFGKLTNWLSGGGSSDKSLLEKRIARISGQASNLDND